MGMLWVRSRLGRRRARDDSGPDYLLIPTHKQSGGNVAAVGDSPAGGISWPSQSSALTSSLVVVAIPSTSPVDDCPCPIDAIRHRRRPVDDDLHPPLPSSAVDNVTTDCIPVDESHPPSQQSTKIRCHRPSPPTTTSIPHCRRPIGQRRLRRTTAISHRANEGRHSPSPFFRPQSILAIRHHPVNDDSHQPSPTMTTTTIPPPIPQRCYTAIIADTTMPIGRHSLHLRPPPSLPHSLSYAFGGRN